MQSQTDEKMILLRSYLKELGSVAVAFSGGVDSTFLLKTARDVLGDKAIAVTARFGAVPQRESLEAQKFCKEEGIPQVICDFDVAEVDGFSENPPNRCYLCKRQLFTVFCRTAARHRMSYVAEGSNVDDEGDYRPGMQAIAELGIKSPLRHVRLTKQEIRDLSRRMGLSTWEKPSYACLASRFVYGERITAEKLSMVERAEQTLMDLGFHQFRVRIHGRMARIEVLPEEIGRFMEEEVRSFVTSRLREYGFTYVTLDLYGYRVGSMNETIL